jgi:hypothetical protein
MYGQLQESAPTKAASAGGLFGQLGGAAAESFDSLNLGNSDVFTSQSLHLICRVVCSFFYLSKGRNCE